MQNWEGIFDIDSKQTFEKWALKIYAFQYENNKVYRQFCTHIGRKQPKSISEIPFLPISAFKHHQVRTEGLDTLTTFKSSGTSKSIRSVHQVQNEEIYKRSFFKHFESHFGKLSDFTILALLPNYIDQGESSLIYMVDHLIKATKNENSGFVLNDVQSIASRISNAKKEKRKVLLFGVSYALIDLAEMKMDLSEVIIIETGGMKGKRKEWTKEELHQYLFDELNQPEIHSEYGMTELFSQGYSKKDGLFQLPKWMDCKIRATNDPFEWLPDGKTGGINVIDLANVFSCSFIATDDLGQTFNKELKLMGRIDHSDIRGCNLLVE